MTFLVFLFVNISADSSGKYSSLSQLTNLHINTHVHTH